MHVFMGYISELNLHKKWSYCVCCLLQRIFYDQNGGEALICCDSEEGIVEEEVERRDFV